MLITFKSKAGGDVMMFGDVAKQLLSVMGKQAGKEGVVTVEQLPEIIARLRAIDAQPVADEKDEQSTSDARVVVSLKQRAVPLIELLERALKEKAPVTWSA